MGGGVVQVQVPIPNSLYFYNQLMAGLSDQLIQYHETQCQVDKYWKTLFFHCIDISVTNAYLLYK